MPHRCNGFPRETHEGQSNPDAFRSRPMTTGSEVALLAHLTHERLIALRLPGMAKLSNSKGDPQISPPCFSRCSSASWSTRGPARDTKAARHAPQVRGVALERRSRGHRFAPAARH